MCVPVCMFVLTNIVLLRSRWWVVMSVTSIEANCGQVGIRSPQGWVRSTTLTPLFRLLPGPGREAHLQLLDGLHEHDAKKHQDDDRNEQLIGLKAVLVLDDHVAQTRYRRQKVRHHSADQGAADRQPNLG